MPPNNELLKRVAAVRHPNPVMSRRHEQSLTRRQREILDELVIIFHDGFRHLTMAELSRRLRCSLRTLYAITTSRDELVLIVLDRNLWRLGRLASKAIEPDMSPLRALQEYLSAANVAVSRRTQAFARDFAAVPAARELAAEHSEYLYDVTKALLQFATECGDIQPVDTTLIARVMASLGAVFSDPDVIPTLAGSPKEAADSVLAFMLQGLCAPGPAVTMSVQPTAATPPSNSSNNEPAVLS